MITAETIHKSKRVAGNVIRYHTWPTITNQTVADHTYHVIRLYHELFADNVNLAWDDDTLAFILKHDMGEQKVGDLPYPVKKNDPELAARVAIQEDIALGIQGWPRSEEVDQDRRAAIKICDLLEMAEFAAYECNLGNQYAKSVFTRVTEHVLNGFAEFWSDYPVSYKTVRDFIFKLEGGIQ